MTPQSYHTNHTVNPGTPLLCQMAALVFELALFKAQDQFSDGFLAGNYKGVNLVNSFTRVYGGFYTVGKKTTLNNTIIMMLSVYILCFGTCNM